MDLRSPIMNFSRTDSQVGNFKTVRYLLRSKQSRLLSSGSPLRGVCKLKCGSASLLLLCAEHPLQQPQYLDPSLLARSDCTPIRGRLCTTDGRVHQAFVGLKMKIKLRKEPHPTWMLPNKLFPCTVL